MKKGTREKGKIALWVDAGDDDDDDGGGGKSLLSVGINLHAYGDEREREARERR